jgi:antitoxin component of MazEF toxin-antitoxin module
MSQAVLKWGNSLAFRIPAAVAKQMGIAEGAALELRVEGQRMIIEKADEFPAFSQDDLAKALRKTKRTLVDYGRPRGNEIL